MSTNTPAQKYICNVNAGGSNQAGSPYALLTRIAELDVELAKQATAVGLAVKLLFPDDPSTFLTAAPQIVAHKTTP
jgi:hypothetical protein